jgi:hypothetical protein
MQKVNDKWREGKNRNATMEIRGQNAKNYDEMGTEKM